MTREIKFRAKVCMPLDVVVVMPSYYKEGDWVAGDLHLRTRIPHIHYTACDKFPIDITTIGQFIGIRDKNGKEIYEGDIVKTLVSPLNATKHKRYRNFVIKYNPPQFWNGYDAILMMPNYMEVIGNIHDNPELLKQE